MASGGAWAVQDQTVSVADTDTIDDGGQGPVVPVPRGHWWQPRVRSHRTAQRAAAVVAAVVGVAVAVWVIRSIAWLDVCHGRSTAEYSCSRPAQAVRYSMVAVAMVGSALGLVITAYLGRFAKHGLIWRRSNALAVAFAAVVGTWFVLYGVLRILLAT